MYYPHYIFDLYGTLVDIRTKEDSPVLWKRTALWYQEHGAIWEGKKLHACYLALCNKEQERFSDPLAEIELRNVFRELFMEKGVTPSKELIEETACFFRICSIKKLKLYPWVKPAFQKLHGEGSSLYLLSNAQACFTVRELQGLGLLDAFDGIVISSEEGIKKPSPRLLQTLLDRYHLPKEECLMVGNEPEADINMASAAGIDTLYLKTETSPDKVMPVHATKMLLDEDFRKIDELLKRRSSLRLSKHNRHRNHFHSRVCRHQRRSNHLD